MALGDRKSDVVEEFWLRIGLAMRPLLSRASRSGLCLYPVEVISIKLDTWRQHGQESGLDKERDAERFQ